MRILAIAPISSVNKKTTSGNQQNPTAEGFGNFLLQPSGHKILHPTKQKKCGANAMYASTPPLDGLVVFWVTFIISPDRKELQVKSIYQRDSRSEPPKETRKSSNHHTFQAIGAKGAILQVQVCYNLHIVDRGVFHAWGGFLNKIIPVWCLKKKPRNPSWYLMTTFFVKVSLRIPR